MRNNPIVNKVHAALIIVTISMLTGNVAHAGLLNIFKEAAKKILPHTENNQNKTATKDEPQGNKPHKRNFLFSAKGTSPRVSKKVDILIANIAKQTGSSIENTFLDRAALARAEKVEVVNTATHTEIVPEYSTTTGLTFILRYDDQALLNPVQIAKELALLSVITSSKLNSTPYFSWILDGSVIPEVILPHSIAELLINAHAGSSAAQARWLSIQARVLKQMTVDSSLTQALDIEPMCLQKVSEEIQLQLPTYEQKAEKHARAQQKALDTWKKETGTLEKLEALESKLDDLIMINDRTGVRKLLEAYLPWHVMEPTEYASWKNWLEAIEHPDSKNTTIAFRGLKYDTDKVQKRETAQGVTYGFMSTVLTKNQGSYTRRLRSLATNRIKNGDIGLKANKELSEHLLAARMSDQMFNHAKNPTASSFISFTYSPFVATRFMGEDIEKNVNGKQVRIPYGGIVVVKVDSRRMIPNITSGFGGEIELLAPLIIFPDEVIDFHEGSFTDEYPRETYINEISKKLGMDFNDWKKAVDEKNENLKTRYIREGFGFFKSLTEINSRSKSCSAVFN